MILRDCVNFHAEIGPLSNGRSTVIGALSPH